MLVTLDPVAKPRIPLHLTARSCRVANVDSAEVVHLRYKAGPCRSSSKVTHVFL